MEAEIIWLAPLLILPGVGLLIVSTSTRFGTLHDEIHHWTDGTHGVEELEMVHLVERATTFEMHW